MPMSVRVCLCVRLSERVWVMEGGGSGGVGWKRRCTTVHVDEPPGASPMRLTSSSYRFWAETRLKFLASETRPASPKAPTRVTSVGRAGSA